MDKTMSKSSTSCDKIFTKIFSPKLTILNNNYHFIFLKKKNMLIKRMSGLGESI